MKILLKNLGLFLVLVMLIIGFQSCEKEQINPKTNSTSELFGIEKDISQQSSKIRNIFAKTLASALENQKLRAYLKDKYEKLEEKDREFLYAEFYKDKVGNVPLHELLASYADKGVDPDFFLALPTNDPLLTIDFPDVSTFTIGTWNLNVVPDVANYLGSSTATRGYNSKGQVLEFTADDIPSKVTLIVKTSEKSIVLNTKTWTTLDGSPLSDILPTKSPKDICDELLAQIIQLEVIIELADEFGVEPSPNIIIEYEILYDLYLEFCFPDTNGGDPCDEKCDRDCVEADETMFKFKLGGAFGGAKELFKAFDCGWFEKYADFRYIVVFEDAQGNPALPNPLMFSGGSHKKSDILNCSWGNCEGIWITRNQRIWKDWDLDEIADVMYYNWIEIDGTQVTVEFEAGVSATLKFKVKVGKLEVSFEPEISLGVSWELECNDIFQLGNGPVFYCDDADNLGTLYDTGDFQYYVGHKE